MLVVFGDMVLVDDSGVMISNPKSLGGSIYFSGISSSNLSVANDVDFRMGTEDFTIEWFQYMLGDSGSTTRIFQMGTWPNATIGVSIEGSASSRNFYYWEGGSIRINTSIPGAIITNKWLHFAVVRASGFLKLFINGSQVGSNISSSYNYTDSVNNLRIGQESGLFYSSSSFKGYITNFRWTKGTAVYTSNFNIPSSPIPSIPNTKLLILASDETSAYKDSSGLNKIIANTNVSWSNTNPFI